MSNIVVCKGEGALENQAEEIAQNLGLALVTEPGSELTLLVDKDGVALMGYGLSFRGDFENMLRRVTNGRVQHEMIARLVKTKEENPTVIDATAGMGEDSILLAACGYKVTMFEQNPVIADGILAATMIAVTSIGSYLPPDIFKPSHPLHGC